MQADLLGTAVAAQAPLTPGPADAGEPAWRTNLFSLQSQVITVNGHSFLGGGGTTAHYVRKQGHIPVGGGPLSLSTGAEICRYSSDNSEKSGWRPEFTETAHHTFCTASELDGR